MEGPKALHYSVEIKDAHLDMSMNVRGFTSEKQFHEVASSVFVADILSRHSCGEILEEFRNAHEWSQAKVAIMEKNSSGFEKIVGVVDVEKRNANRIRLADLDMANKPNTLRHLSKVQRAVGEFASIKYGLDFRKSGSAEIVRYPVGGEFTPHTDTHSGNSHRAFTVVIYLNDEFSAGGTSFPDLNYVCIPKAGRVLFFSSTQLHAGLPASQGEKNIIVFWVFFPGTLDRHLDKYPL